jgi:hypothetical protein
VLITLCLDQPGVILCWVVLLAHILGGLMEQTFNLDLLYVIHVIQEHYCCGDSRSYRAQTIREN